MGAQKIGTMLLFNQLPHLVCNGQRKDEVFEPLTRLRFEDGVASGMTTRSCACR